MFDHISINKFRNLIKQIFRFGIVGVIATAIDYILLLGFTEIVHINYMISAAMSFSIACVVNYILSIKWVFVNRKKYNRIFELVVFIALSTVGLLINQFFMWLFTEKLFVDYRVSKIFAVAIVMLWNFISRKLFLEKRESNMAKILVTGAAGQLGTDVIKELTKRNVEYTGIDVTEGAGIEYLDITDSAAVQAYMISNKPQSVIHCAAYTAVDKAEDEQDLCFRINAEGTENLAKACRETDAEMIYISTDYVFGGEGDEPYETDAVKAPVSIYGKSKLAGEEAVIKNLEKYYIVRISWFFGHEGSNFVKTMLKLSETRTELSVVDDQVGSPTYSPDVSALLCEMALSGKYGIYHVTNEGFCSWAQFANEIMRQSGSSCEINPIPSELYPTKAVRPKNSRLSKSSLDTAGFSRLPKWQDALIRYIGKEA